jgi:hypothetical protein
LGEKVRIPLIVALILGSNLFAAVIYRLGHWSARTTMGKSGSKKRTRKSRRSTKPVGKSASSCKSPKRIDISINELKSILERTRSGPLTEEDRLKLGGAVDTLAVVTSELESKGASIRRLQQLIFGSSSEKTRDVLGNRNCDESAENKENSSVKSDADETNESGSERASSEPDGETPAADTNDATGEKKRKGHGRNGASEYKGADKVKIPHESLKHKDRCPECKRGSLTRAVNDLNEDALRRIVLANLTNRQVADSVRMEYLKRIDRLEQFNSTNR